MKAVIFDFDGLLLDTETPWYYVFKEAYSAYGLELPLSLWAGNVGTNFEEFHPYKYLEQQVGEPIDLKRLQSDLEHNYELRMKNAQLLPGVDEALQQARQRGMRLAIASSSTRDWVFKYLQYFELLPLFDAVVTSDDVKCVKPDPELYKLAMHQLGVSPNETLAFEDSPNGLKAANAAGIRCIIVPNEVTRELDFPPYERRLASLLEFDFEQLSLEDELMDLA
ncbi:HAD family hydrolase [Paenibacillus sp. FSL R10-2734]|uniref:HAD family hydrolase n=1 Tax=Paenibacillus sp. FSL R10-2734 TaxID=2954691 RepID=UPI0030D7C4AF